MMARSSDFAFPALTQGEFFHKVFETGKVMVGWGRGSRSKFVQLDQAEITSFLEHAREMVRTDDSVLADLLGQLAKHLTSSKPRWASIAEIGEASNGDPVALKAAARWMELHVQGVTGDEALAKVNAEFALA